jgi:hypothetical protein
VKPLALILAIVLAPLRIHLIAPVTGSAISVPFPALMLAAELLVLPALFAGVFVLARRNGGFRVLVTFSSRLRAAPGGAS